MFAEMMKSDKGINEANHAVTCLDKFKNFVCMRVQWPTCKDVWKISPEQKKAAGYVFAKRREEQLAKANRPGVLTLKTMGMNFQSRLQDGIGNSRVSGRFYDKSGNRWFVEFKALYKWEKKSACPCEEQLVGEIVDETFNEQENIRYNSEFDALEEKYKNVKLIPRSEIPKSPVYKYENFREELPYTRQGVLDFINKRFGTDFTELHLEEYFFEYHEVVSKCN